MAAFLANVGVNSSHAARSPMFGDGSFLLVPIPEKDRWSPPMLRLSDFDGLADHAPAAWRDRAVHLDPDLSATPPTYGDNCRRAGRAFSLRRAAAGDLIVFLARLHPENATPGFHLVGCLSVEDALTDVTSDPGLGCGIATRMFAALARPAVGIPSGSSRARLEALEHSRRHIDSPDMKPRPFSARAGGGPPHAPSCRQSAP